MERLKKMAAKLAAYKSSILSIASFICILILTLNNYFGKNIILFWVIIVVWAILFFFILNGILTPECKQRIRSKFTGINKKRIGELAVGWLTDRVTNWVFEYVMYPAAIAYWGLVNGGAVMIVLSVVISLAVIRLYDFLKIDWLGLEAVKELRDGEVKTMLERITQWAMKKGDLFALIVLSIYSEPVKVTLYMRHGSNQFNGFSKRDWAIFTTSVVIGNVSWALAVAGGIEIFRKFF